jgi:hypothetical protein
MLLAGGNSSVTTTTTLFICSLTWSQIPKFEIFWRQCTRLTFWTLSIVQISSTHEIPESGSVSFFVCEDTASNLNPSISQSPEEVNDTKLLVVEIWKKNSDDVWCLNRIILSAIRKLKCVCQGSLLERKMDIPLRHAPEPQPALGFIQWMPDAVALGSKRQGREADHSTSI